MEFLSLPDIRLNAEAIRAELNSTLANKALVGRSRALQWELLRGLLHLTLGLTSPVGLSTDRIQLAQLRFEADDKLRRFYLRPGAPLRYAFTIKHQRALRELGIRLEAEYPCYHGYYLLVRAVQESPEVEPRSSVADTKLLLEKIVADAVDAEFEAYRSLPDTSPSRLRELFCAEGPAMAYILNILERHAQRGWVLTNEHNPSTKRLIRVDVKEIGYDYASVASVEYWHLRWWSITDEKYAYTYRETNRQSYILCRLDGGWKIHDNLRPGPRTSMPNRRLR